MDSIFPFDRCPFDILIPIFKAVVDAEVEKWTDKSSSTEITRPQATILLALVCRHWKNIVYETPSLWTKLVFDFRMDRESLYRDSQRIQGRACSAPISLYLLNVHHKGTCPNGRRWNTVHSSLSCASGLKDVTALVAQVAHIGQLHIEFAHVSTRSGGLCHPSVLKQSHPQLGGVDHFTVDLSQSTARGQYALLKQVGMMPRLVELRVHGLTACSVTDGSRTKLLPLLKRLYITSTDKDISRCLISNLLSHCPILEELDMRMESENKPLVRRTLSLRHLRTVTMSWPEGVFTLFTSKGVEIPALKEIRYVGDDVVDVALVTEFSKLHPSVRIN